MQLRVQVQVQVQLQVLVQCRFKGREGVAEQDGAGVNVMACAGSDAGTNVGACTGAGEGAVVGAGAGSGNEPELILVRKHHHRHSTLGLLARE